MDTTKILNELKTEQARIEKAIAAISALGKLNGSGSTTGQIVRRRRRMSAEGRRRISEAAKRRWAAIKKRA